MKVDVKRAAKIIGLDDEFVLSQMDGIIDINEKDICENVSYYEPSDDDVDKYHDELYIEYRMELESLFWCTEEMLNNWIYEEFEKHFMGKVYDDNLIGDFLDEYGDFVSRFDNIEDMMDNMDNEQLNEFNSISEKYDFYSIGGGPEYLFVKTIVEEARERYEESSREVDDKISEIESNIDKIFDEAGIETRNTHKYADMIYRGEEIKGDSETHNKLIAKYMLLEK